MNDIDMTNIHGVSVHAENIVVLAPSRRMTYDEALVFAAWIVAIADHSDDHAEFDKILAAVES